MAVAIPNASITIRDNGLGIVSSGPDGVCALIGTSSGGVAGTFYAYAGADTNGIGDDLGEGPLPDQLVKHLLHGGGRATYGYKVSPSTPGASSAVTRSGGTSGPTLTVSGTPSDYADARIVIVDGGARGTATFQYSDDGGDTYTDPIATAATYLLDSGVTATFPTSNATMTGSPNDVDFTTTTITRNTGSFVTDGFHIGMTITITGTASNNVTVGPLTNVTATVLTVASGLVVEANVATAAITGVQLYVAGETYSWTDTAPIMSTTNVGDAIDALIDAPFDVECVHVLGQAASPAASATMATLLATKMEAAWAAHRYMFAVFEAPADTPANIASAFANFEDKAVMGCAGFAEIINDRTGAVEKRSSARVIVPRIARNPIAIRLERDAADSDLDSLSDVDELVPAGAAASSGYLDEDKTPLLNAAHFSTLRTISGRAGFYITNPLTMAADTSDFQQLQYLRIILKAARVWYLFALTQLGRRVPTSPTGTIKPTFAKAIEDAGRNAIKVALGDAISDARVLVNRNDQIVSDPTLRAKVRVKVDGYIVTFDSDIGLTANLTALAA